MQDLRICIQGLRKQVGVFPLAFLRSASRCDHYNQRLPGTSQSAAETVPTTDVMTFLDELFGRNATGIEEREKEGFALNTLNHASLHFYVTSNSSISAQLVILLHQSSKMNPTSSTPGKNSGYKYGYTQTGPVTPRLTPSGLDSDVLIK